MELTWKDTTTPETWKAMREWSETLRRQAWTKKKKRGDEK